MVYHICQLGYNQSQETAIHAAVRLCRVADTDPRVLLLQGPPGTGKSHTIIGIITAIVKVGGNSDKCIKECWKSCLMLRQIWKSMLLQI